MWVDGRLFDVLMVAPGVCVQTNKVLEKLDLTGTLRRRNTACVLDGEANVSVCRLCVCR
jgi:hypothetical protein